MSSETGGDSRNVSHYLLRPLRSYDEAVREQARRLREIQDAQHGNDVEPASAKADTTQKA